MQRFNPKIKREILLGSSGYKLDLSSSLSDAERVKGLTSGGKSFIETAIQCFLVGLNEPGFQLLKKASDWLDIAIGNNEIPKRYFPYGTEAARYYCKAIVNWLLNGVHDKESLRYCIENQNQYLPNIKRDKIEVSFMLPRYLDARLYQKAIDIFLSTPSLKIPLHLNKIETEAEMVYVICKFEKGEIYEKETVITSIKSYLNRNLNKWLVSGHFTRAAQWMKIIYWKEGNVGLTPQEALLKCYDHV